MLLRCGFVRRCRRLNGAFRTFSSTNSCNNSSSSRDNGYSGDAEEGHILAGHHQKYSFLSDYYVKAPKDLHSVRPGGYTDITRSEIAEYLPEGFAGDTAAEFTFSGRSTWMIRDVSKLLLGLLQQFERTTNVRSSESTESRQRARFSDDAEVQGLTDRPERLDAIMRVQLRGTDLVNTIPSENPKRQALRVVKDNGSVVDKCLDAITADGGFPSKILLTGSRGSGKSVALSQMVYFARKRGWICFFVPNAWDHAQNGAYVEPVTTNQGELKYNNVILSVDALRGFLNAHSEILKTIPISDKSKLAKYSETIDKFTEGWKQALAFPGRENLSFLEMRRIIEDEDNFADEDEKDRTILNAFDFLNFRFETLYDLALLGVALRDLSGSIVLDVVEELRELEIDRHPVLLAVDQVNTWDVPSSYEYENVPIMSKDICVPHALNFISKKKVEMDSFTMKNGFCIGAVSFKHSEGNKTHYIDAKNSIPLLIHVPVLNQVEFLSTMLYYSELGRIGKDHTLQELLALRMHCGSNPQLLRSETISFLLPLSGNDVDEMLLDPREHEENISNDVIASEGQKFWYDNNEKIFNLSQQHAD